MRGTWGGTQGLCGVANWGHLARGDLEFYIFWGFLFSEMVFLGDTQLASPHGEGRWEKLHLQRWVSPKSAPFPQILAEIF